MKIVMREERIGENRGPIDWTYNFLPHFAGHGHTAEGKQQACDMAVEYMRTIEKALADGVEVLASTYGGWPRIWQPVLMVGMYDGWPYWRPVPSVALQSPLGGCEWHDFSQLTGVRIPSQEPDRC